MIRIPYKKTWKRTVRDVFKEALPATQDELDTHDLYLFPKSRYVLYVFIDELNYPGKVYGEYELKDDQIYLKTLERFLVNGEEIEAEDLEIQDSFASSFFLLLQQLDNPSKIIYLSPKVFEKQLPSETAAFVTFDAVWKVLKNQMSPVLFRTELAAKCYAGIGNLALANRIDQTSEQKQKEFYSGFVKQYPEMGERFKCLCLRWTNPMAKKQSKEQSSKNGLKYNG